MTNPNDLAYPDFSGRNNGLTKLEEFTKAALTGLCKNVRSLEDLEYVGYYAVKAAQKTIKELNKIEQ